MLLLHRFYYKPNAPPGKKQNFASLLTNRSTRSSMLCGVGRMVAHTLTAKVGKLQTTDCRVLSNSPFPFSALKNRCQTMRPVAPKDELYICIKVCTRTQFAH